MLLPNGEVLMHDDAPYDAAKAHAYYLQYRKLHPRGAGAITAPKGRSPTSEMFTVKEGNGKTVRLNPQQLAEQKVYAAARVTAIKDKLVQLNDALKKKLAAAAKSEADAKNQTPAEKAAAAKASADYASKHKQQIANKAKTAAAKAPPKAPAKPKADTVATLKTKIVAAKASLTDAVNKQRELATATKSG